MSGFPNVKMTRSTFGAELNSLGDTYELSDTELMADLVLTARELVARKARRHSPCADRVRDLDFRSVFDALEVEDAALRKLIDNATCADQGGASEWDAVPAMLDFHGRHVAMMLYPVWQ